jgi:hypothetical protein
MIPMWNEALRRWTRGVGVAIATAAIVGIPTDVVDTAYFTRMTPVRWWEYPVLGLTAMLTGLWATIPRAASDVSGRSGVVGAVTTTVFAIGCPVCNKIVVGLLGLSGALGVWGPIQPILAVLSLAALGCAVVVRWRRRACAADTCNKPADSDAVYPVPAIKGFEVQLRMLTSQRTQTDAIEE